MKKTITPIEQPLDRSLVRNAADPVWADFPSHAGRWDWKASFNDTQPVPVEVTETHAGGRLCRMLGMGGSSQCPGYSNWAGLWSPAHTPVYGKPELTRAA